MNIKEVLTWLGTEFNLFDVIAIVMTYFFAQRLKGLFEKDEYKRIVVFLCGGVVAAMLCSAFGEWGKWLFYAGVYTAGAILLYEIDFASIITRAGELIKSGLTFGKGTS